MQPRIELHHMKKDKLFLPDKKLLKKTGEVDYFNWSYKFPIKYVINYRFHRIRKLLGDKKIQKNFRK